MQSGSTLIATIGKIAGRRRANQARQPPTTIGTTSMSSAATDIPFTSRLLRTRFKLLLSDIITQGTWLLPALILTVTTLLLVAVRNDELRIASLDTEQQTQRTMAQLQRHLDNHIQILHSAAALLMLDRIVQSQHWNAYLQHLQRLGLPAGLRQLGYAQHIATTDKVALMNAMHADGRPDYQIYPLRNGETAIPVLHAAPESGNLVTRAGYDLLSDTLLAPALQRATDSATATLASVQERVGMARQFLLLLPVFPGNTVPEGIEQRRKMLVGFVFTVVEINADLMTLKPASALPLSLRLFEQQTSTSGALLYQSPGELFTERRTLQPVNLYGQNWTLETSSPGVPATASIGVAVTGMLLAGWLCWLTRDALQRREFIRQRARHEAHETRQIKLQLSSLTALNRQAIIRIDHQQRIIAFNGAAGRLFGTGDENLLGTPLRELLPNQLKGARPIAPLAPQTDEVAVFQLSGQADQQARHRNGSLFGFEATVFMIGTGLLRCYTILLNELPSNSPGGDILNDWQKCLTQEIHDDLGQLLTAMKMDMGLLREQLIDRPGGQIPALPPHLDRIDALVDAMVGSVRRILAHLSPGQIDEGELFKALALLVDGHAKRYQIACHLDLPACTPEIGIALANQLYRIVQEALNNIAKHASASAVTIDIDATPDQLLVAISDNGCGFVPQQQFGPEAHGLTGMQERVKALGGALHIETKVDCGTTIRIKLPLNATRTS
ncbi:MAG: signal transduction histidine kinase [Burkholderiaceae bacterium]